MATTAAESAAGNELRDLSAAAQHLHHALDELHQRIGHLQSELSAATEGDSHLGSDYATDVFSVGDFAEALANKGALA